MIQPLQGIALAALETIWTGLARQKDSVVKVFDYCTLYRKVLDQTGFGT